MIRQPGVILYRCRRCEGLDSSLHTPDIDTSILAAVSTGRDPYGPTQPLVGWHRCADGAMGVTDLIGGVPDPKEPSL